MRKAAVTRAASPGSAGKSAVAVRGSAYPWAFRPRFRRHAFGWRSQPAVKRVREAVAEIRKVARQDRLLAAEGAVLFLEKLSPALEHVDSSSGTLGTAVNNAIQVLVEIIATAPADEPTRAKWLERLFEAHAADQIPYIELLAEHWGELCASPELASRWADQLIDITRHTLQRKKSGEFAYFHGTPACLSALYAAGRHDDLLALLEEEEFWPHKRWAAQALAALGRKAEAIRLAECSRGAWASDLDIDRLCEALLLSSGLVEEAYRCYGLHANRAGTYLAWFRAVAKKYPHKSATELLADLVAESPGEEGKWFAAAKDAQLFDEAIALARRAPCAPQTLTRAARDFALNKPEFAIEAGLAALHWLVEGYGYDVTPLDVLNAYTETLRAAGHAGRAEETRRRVHDVVLRKPANESFVKQVLDRHLGQW
jgi:hypothetical protein